MGESPRLQGGCAQIGCVMGRNASGILQDPSLEPQSFVYVRSRWKSVVSLTRGIVNAYAACLLEHSADKMIPEHPICSSRGQDESFSR